MKVKKIVLAVSLVILLACGVYAAVLMAGASPPMTVPAPM